jgi:uncharacterized RDD family membrane protein YckC
VDELRSASVGRRFLAGVIDLAILSAFGFGLSLGPLSYGGAALPMIGSLIAISAYTIAPASVFGATLGMAAAGIRIRSQKGGSPDATEIAFRELVGRGLIGAAYFATAAIGLAGYLTGYLHFFVPRGLGLLLFLISGALIVFSLGSHLAIVLRPDGRALHDLFTRTVIVRAGEDGAPEEEDEDARSFARARRRGRLRSFVLAEVVLLAGGLALPMFAAQAPSTGADLEERVALRRAEKAFDKDRTDPEAATELASLHRAAGREGDALEVEAAHRAALDAAGIQPSDRDYLVRKQRALLKASPCALGPAVELGERLNELDDHDRALELVAKLEADCGARPRLWWVALTAHREKGEHDLAIADSTKLIADRPTDSDFWWWRGEDHAKKGDSVRAEADYRQSMAVYADGFAAKRLAELLRERDPCEGIFALQHLIDENPEAADSWAESSLAELQLRGSCAGKTGKGSAKLTIASDLSVRAPATIGKKRGRFLVHPTGLVTVTKAFAAEAGLEPSETIEVRIAERAVPARLAVADRIAVAGSSAERVQVAVVDELPAADIDGLLGLSYLWRFRIERGERSIALSPR